jgi:Flp pilus assembly protein TadG
MKITNFNLRSHRQTDAGQAMVEFMLVIIFLSLLFVSVIQIILLMHAYNTLANAAKEGIRYAIVHGTENTICSGPGNPNVSPVITCTDASAANVVSRVTNFAALSFQNISSTNNGCTPTAGSGVNEVDVCYDPNSANTNSIYAHPCSAPGCLVRVVVRHTYRPFFGLGWPSFNLYAAADGRIMN